MEGKRGRANVKVTPCVQGYEEFSSSSSDCLRTVYPMCTPSSSSSSSSTITNDIDVGDGGGDGVRLGGGGGEGGGRGGAGVREALDGFMAAAAEALAEWPPHVLDYLRMVMIARGGAKALSIRSETVAYLNHLSVGDASNIYTP